MTPHLRSGRIDAMALAAVHAWASAQAPKLVKVTPEAARGGEVVVLTGNGLGAPGLTARFGSAETWTTPLGDDAAVALVPPGAGPGLVYVQRGGLRSNSLAFGDMSDDEPPRVLRVDPADGAVNIFRDAPVVVRLSHAVDVASVTPGTVTVGAGSGPLPAEVWTSPDGLVVVLKPWRPMAPNVPHRVWVDGLHDRRGRVIPPHASCFVPCPLRFRDVH